MEPQSIVSVAQKMDVSPEALIMALKKWYQENKNEDKFTLLQRIAKKEIEYRESKEH